MRHSEVERLYNLMGHRLYRRCLYLLREEQSAMDVVQDVYTALLEKFVGFPDDSRAAAWLLKVATNKCLNEIRRRKYWKSLPIERPGDEGSANPFPDLDDRLVFEKLLSSMPADKASMITGYFLEGCTMEEVAAEAGCSVPTVRRAVAAFLEKGRARMEREKQS